MPAPSTPQRRYRSPRRCASFKASRARSDKRAFSPRDARFDTQLPVAHHFVLPPPHARRFEHRTRREDFHRPATQSFEQAQLQLALPFDVQLTQRHGLHLLGNDAVELQGPGGWWDGCAGVSVGALG